MRSRELSFTKSTPNFLLYSVNVRPTSRKEGLLVVQKRQLEIPFVAVFLLFTGERACSLDNINEASGSCPAAVGALQRSLAITIEDGGFAIRHCYYTSSRSPFRLYTVKFM